MQETTLKIHGVQNFFKQNATWQWEPDSSMPLYSNSTVLSYRTDCSTKYHIHDRDCRYVQKYGTSENAYSYMSQDTNTKQPHSKTFFLAWMQE